MADWARANRSTGREAWNQRGISVKSAQDQRASPGSGAADPTMKAAVTIASPPAAWRKGELHLSMPRRSLGTVYRCVRQLVVTVAIVRGALASVADVPLPVVGMP